MRQLGLVEMTSLYPEAKRVQSRVDTEDMNLSQNWDPSRPYYAQWEESARLYPSVSQATSRDKQFQRPMVLWLCCFLDMVGYSIMRVVGDRAELLTCGNQEAESDV